MLSDLIVPPALTRGSTIRVVAPSGAFDRTLVLRGLGFLATRYRIEYDWSLFSRHQMFAGTDERRLAELNRALSDPGVHAVVAARGGYGLTRVLPRVLLSRIREAPRWVVGFSDLTALHVELAQCGVASIHAAHVAALGRGDAAGREQWLAALEDPWRRQVLSGLEPWSPGAATGRLTGGNLTMLFTCAAAGRLRFPDGVVLLIEDVTEAAYRIDRMLTALLTSGVLDRVAAIIVGDLTDCPAGRLGISAACVVRERLANLGVPVVGGLPVGHGPVNTPVPLGRSALVDGTHGVVVFNP